MLVFDKFTFSEEKDYFVLQGNSNLLKRIILYPKEIMTCREVAEDLMQMITVFTDMFLEAMSVDSAKSHTKTLFSALCN